MAACLLLGKLTVTIRMLRLEPQHAAYVEGLIKPKPKTFPDPHGQSSEIKHIPKIEIISTALDT